MHMVSKLWDDATLADIPAPVDLSVDHYPVLGAQAGFSRASTIPILLSQGQHLGQSI
jgi:hypothetical protein